jgi:hypothetical protein
LVIDAAPEGNMGNRDWTGTAAAIVAVVMTAGVWLWNPSPAPAPRAAGDEHAARELAQWRFEASRWSADRAAATETQLSSVDADFWRLPEGPAPVTLR